MIFPPTYVVLLILVFPCPSTAHPAGLVILGMGVAASLGGAGPLLLVGMAAVAIGVIVGTALLDESHRPPTRRSRPPIHIDPPGAERTPEEENTTANTPTTSTPPRDILDIPLADVIPEETHGLLAPRSLSSAPRSKIFTDPLRSETSSHTSTDDANTIVPDEESKTESASHEEDQNAMLRGLTGAIHPGNSQIPTSISLHGPSLLMRVRSDEINPILSFQRHGQEDRESTQSDNSQESSLSNSSWSDRSSPSVSSSIAEGRLTVMTRASFEGLFTLNDIVAKPIIEPCVGKRAERNENLKQNVEGFVDIVNGESSGAAESR